MIATFERVAKWYGHVVGLVDAHVEVGTGVTGLLGPNGAGKSTFLKLLTGQLRPSMGTVRIFEKNPFTTPSILRRIGFLPEPEAFYESQTGRQFVTYLTRLHGFSAGEARRRADDVIERVGLAEAARRPIRTYSKGMRQRIKLAQAMAHDPEVLVLDEPLTGMDPVGRRQTIDVIRELGENGATVIVSSHILHEVEAMTEQLILLYEGRVRAWGTRSEIRSVLDDVPHRIRVGTPRPRELARLLVDSEHLVAVRMDGNSLVIETRNPEAFYDHLPAVVLDEGIPIESVEAEDVGIEAIFEYLVA